MISPPKVWAGAPRKDTPARSVGHYSSICFARKSCHPLFMNLVAYLTEA